MLPLDFPQAPHGGSAPDGGPTIVVAEDHPDSRFALQALLEANGYTVHLATNGLEAVRTVLAVQPNLVLMDIMMPELDGLEATRRIRADERFEKTPIIALTAMEGARSLALAAGCDDCVIKPIDVPAFFGLVREWVQLGRPGRST